METRSFLVSRQKEGQEALELIVEEPLSIRVQGQPYAVVMRTPGDEYAHVAGFSLGEGVVDTPQDIQTIAYCGGEDSNVVTLTVTPERLGKIVHILERKGFVSQTSCGICGKELINDLRQVVTPLPDCSPVDLGRAVGCLEELRSHQVLYEKTRASHAAAIFDEGLRLISIGEDVGRHNALDKAIGKLFLEGRLPAARIVVMSSRISYELVQKAARAKIPIIVAVSRPTSLAVELADSLNMALVSVPHGKEPYVYCGKERFI